jgi:hypothetical protein
MRSAPGSNNCGLRVTEKSLDFRSGEAYLAPFARAVPGVDQAPAENFQRSEFFS